ncbi:MAG: metallophosphoesterase family protein, partial [bacterium]
MHVGDIATSGQCAESNYSMVASIMKGLTVPAYIVTGDNEITDCSSPTQGFSLWMKYFKNFGKNFCGAPLTEHQSTHPANFAFTMKGVLFIGIDLAGSPSPVAKDTVWIKQQLQAKGSQVRAAVIFAHFPPNTSTTFSTPFRRAAAAFGKPVLFLHGHGHSWGMSNPFPEPNILRVQVNKGASEDPVQVTVTMNTSSPSTAFTFKRKPWSLQTIVNMPPCADAGP